MDYNDIIESKSVVLVEFFASWCPHCQKMMPVVAQVKELLSGYASVYQFDIDEYKDLAESEHVESIPTFIIYHDGREVWRRTGEVEGELLLGKLESFLS